MPLLPDSEQEETLAKLKERPSSTSKKSELYQLAHHVIIRAGSYRPDVVQAAWDVKDWLNG